jgi:hypothetical protein
MSQKKYAPDSWQSALQHFQSLQHVLDEFNQCARLTIIFACGDRMENMRGCRRCKDAISKDKETTCPMFKDETLCPWEFCPDCKHKKEQEARMQMEQEKRMSRRVEKAEREKRKTGGLF